MQVGKGLVDRGRDRDVNLNCHGELRMTGNGRIFKGFIALQVRLSWGMVPILFWAP